MTDFRIGLVGAGRLAEAGYVPAAAAAAGVRLAALAEPDPARRARVAAAAGGVAAFPDAGSLLAAGGIDALVLATPATAHLADAVAATAAGVPVLVEKPPAADLDDTAALAALTPAPWIGFNRRFEPGIAELRAAVPVGAEVGLVLELAYRRRSWGAHAVADEVLLDLGPHLVDLARWITRADVTDVLRATVTPDRAEFDLVLGAVRARIRCAADRPHRERVEIRHRRGEVIARRGKGGLVAAVRGRLAPAGPHPLVASLTAQLEALAATVTTGAPGPLLGTAEDGLAVMATLDAVRACAAGGRPVPIDR